MRRHTYTITFVFLFGLTATAQSDTIKKLDLNKVEVIKAFEATLENAQIQDMKAPIPTQKPFNPKYDYDISIVPIELNYPAPQIKPLAMNPDEDFIINKGYVRAAYGHKINPMISGGYHTLRKDAYDIGFHINLNAINNTKQVAFQKHSEATANVFGSYNVRDNLKLSGDLEWNGQNRSLYQTHIDLTTFKPEDLSRKISKGALTVGISNIEELKHDINYNVKLRLQSIGLFNQNLTESGTLLKMHGDKKIKKHLLSLDINSEYYSTSGRKISTLSVFEAEPSIKLVFGRLGALIGGNAVVSSNKKSFSLFPHLDLGYEVWKSKLTVFAEIDQNNYINNAYRTIAFNPYINNRFDSIVNSVSQHYSAGIKGSFGFFDYVGKAGYKQINDQLFFLNDKTDYRFFDLLYDDMNVVFINAKVNFYLTDQITVGGWLTQNIYSAKTLAKTWHLPNTELNAFAQWLGFDDKLKVKSEIFFGTKVDFLSVENKNEQSNLLFDLNIGAEYNISKKFKIFLQGDNLLDNRFERFYGYPSMGINLIGGAQYVF